MVDRLALYRQALKAKQQDKVPDILSYCFDKQKEFIEDPADFKVAFTTRRAGKSTTIGVYIAKIAMENPGCNILYLGLSKQTAFRTLRKDILNPIAKHFRIKTKTTNDQITFPNGSLLFMQGINANEKEMEKVLGQKYHAVFLDEAQSYRIDTEDLIYRALLPTVQDSQGVIVMTGTPTDNTNSFFYQCTRQDGHRFLGWSVHEWNTLHNTIKQADGLSQAEKSTLQINKLKLKSPNIEETDAFQQQFLGKWVLQNSLKVYKLNEDRNLITEPLLIKHLITDQQNWFFVLGIDFGFRDASALTILAYNRHDSNLYVVHSEKHVEWTITDIANRIKDLLPIYRFSNMVGDSAAAQSIAEINKHHGLYIKPTTKLRTKREAVAMVNADLITGNIKINPHECKGLLEEMRKLTWNATAVAEGRYNEVSTDQNHECDAFNYAYHFSRHYRVQAAPEPLSLDKAEDTLKIMKKIGMIKDPKQFDFGKSIFDNKDLSDQEVIHRFRNSIGKKQWT